MPPPSSSAAAQLSAPIDLRRVRELFAVPARVAESNFLRREIDNTTRIGVALHDTIDLFNKPLNLSLDKRYVLRPGDSFHWCPHLSVSSLPPAPTSPMRGQLAARADAFVSPPAELERWNHTKRHANSGC